MNEDHKDRLAITNDTRYLIVMREFVTRMLKRSALQGPELSKVVLAVDEAVTNIIEHAYAPGISGNIEVEVEVASDRVTVRVLDEGEQFDPAHMRDIDISSHIKAGRKKGLGIFLMRRIMDEVKYAFRDGRRNELSLVKYIRGGD